MFKIFSLMKALFFSFLILCFSSFKSSDAASVQYSSCTAPANLSITAQSNNTISFDWEDCSSSFTEYQVFYTKEGQASAIYSTSKSEISFSGLSPGVYQFHFYTICGGASSAIIIEDSIFG